MTLAIALAVPLLAPNLQNSRFRLFAHFGGRRNNSVSRCTWGYAVVSCTPCIILAEAATALWRFGAMADEETGCPSSDDRC